MVSNQVISGALVKIREAAGMEVSVYTQNGAVITADGLKKNADFRSILKFLDEKAEVQEYNGNLYFRVNDGNRLLYIVEIPKSDRAELVGKMTVLQLEAMTASNEERFDKDNFIKNLLLDNLLLVDIYNRAKQLQLDIHARRVAILVETKSKEDGSALELIKTMMADRPDDFVAAIDEHNIIIVKELSEQDSDESVHKFAETVADMLNTETMYSVRVAYGKVADEIRKVSNSYKEAKLALSVGKIFNSEQNVVSYESLGIGRLIYQLPIPMCKMFIEEIFHNQSPEEFDEETLTTINQFFANSLNVSETSRQLYIHRNTLVYRLDKLQKNTGLDLRIFDDAITFKIALMVVKYMHYMENQE